MGVEAGWNGLWCTQPQPGGNFLPDCRSTCCQSLAECDVWSWTAEAPPHPNSPHLEGRRTGSRRDSRDRLRPTESVRIHENTFPARGEGFIAHSREPSESHCACAVPPPSMIDTNVWVDSLNGWRGCVAPGCWCWSRGLPSPQVTPPLATRLHSFPGPALFDSSAAARPRHALACFGGAWAESVLHFFKLAVNPGSSCYLQGARARAPRNHQAAPQLQP